MYLKVLQSAIKKVYYPTIILTLNYYIQLLTSQKLIIWNYTYTKEKFKLFVDDVQTFLYLIIYIYLFPDLKKNQIIFKKSGKFFILHSEKYNNLL